MTEYHIDCVREYDCHREADTIGDAIAEAYDVVRCFTWEDKYEVVTQANAEIESIRNSLQNTDGLVDWAVEGF